MADKTINQLTQATDLTDSSLFVIEQNSTAKQANWGMMKNYISPGVAAQYSTSATYNVGDYVIYNGSLYRCNTAITTGEAWTAAHWTAVSLGDDVTAISSASSYNVLLNYYGKYASVENGVTITYLADGGIKLQGQSTGISWANLYIDITDLPSGLIPGKTYYISFNSVKAKLIIYSYSSGGTANLFEERNYNGHWQAPQSMAGRGAIIRVWLASGVTYDEIVYPKICSAEPNDTLADKTKGFIESIDTASADESAKHDMRTVIQYMLDTYGYCKLGPGVFYINARIDMPEGSTLEGSGEATELRLMSGDGKLAILMKKYSTVNNLSIIGSYTDLTQSDFGESSGSRYGIHYYKGASDGYQTAYCSITNVHIRNFTGSGIYQYGTGGNVEQGLFVSNVHIKNCWCGIHNYFNSEFCRYDNVQITYCYIACINNGGNSAFNNCVFHAYSIGMKIEGERNNSAHGMCTNSSFCHTGNNEGSALTLSNIVHGYVFAACQFWYNSVDISNCEGIVFNGCEFGRGTTGEGATINISNGETIMFNGCVFMNDISYPPDITITNNAKVKFSSCYGSKSGNEITG